MLLFVVQKDILLKVVLFLTVKSYDISTLVFSCIDMDTCGALFALHQTVELQSLFHEVMVTIHTSNSSAMGDCLSVKLRASMDVDTQGTNEGNRDGYGYFILCNLQLDTLNESNTLHYVCTCQNPSGYCLELSISVDKMCVSVNKMNLDICEMKIYAL